MHPTVSGGGVLPYCFPLLQAASIGSWPWEGVFPSLLLSKQLLPNWEPWVLLGGGVAELQGGSRPQLWGSGGWFKKLRALLGV